MMRPRRVVLRCALAGMLWRMLDGNLRALASLWRDTDVMKYLGGPRPPEVARRAAEAFLREGGEAIRAGDEVVGARALRWTTEASPSGARELELVVLLKPSSQGQGLGTGAAQELLAATTEPVVGVTQRANVASQRLMERLGFVRDGAFEQFGAWQVRYVRAR